MPNHLAPYRQRVSLAELTEQQARFAELYAEIGSRKGGAIDAALAAGYGSGTNRQAAKARASELLRNPNVLAAIHDEVGRKLSAASALGVNVLVDLALNAKSETVRLGAARELVDRGHGPIMSRTAVSVDSEAQREAFIASLPLISEEPLEQMDQLDNGRS